LFVTICTIFFSLGGVCQTSENVKVIPAVFNSEIKTNDDLKDFKKLRGFLRKKNDQLTELITRKQRYDDVSDYSNVGLRNKLAKVKSVLDQYPGASDTKEIKTTGDLIYPSIVSVRSAFLSKMGVDKEGLVTTTVSNLKTIKVECENEIISNTNDSLNVANIDASIRNVNQDISDCNGAIDEALAPEYKQQDFRKVICLGFVCLIGLLVVSFFLVVAIRSDVSIGKELLGTTGLQFITLFVLIFSIVLFGILNILAGSELAAILSGISGFILGKGVNNALGAPNHVAAELPATGPIPNNAVKNVYEVDPIAPKPAEVVKG